MKCADCRWWAGSLNWLHYAECHRFPPNLKNSEGIHVFPETLGDDYCGEFSEKEKNEK